ncbi:MAG TPA: vanadium-dependent haloperoxidase [Gemmatimonadaceae bacterium]|nr:vanadium-dependent haloperoxidase [Gemmatimonadaceae bacterium]
MKTCWRRSTLGALLGVAVAACGESRIAAPDAPTGAPALDRAAGTTAQTTSSSVRWNALARDLVTQRRIDPPMAARTYALLSVAQHDAVLAADDVAPGSPQARHRVAARAAVVGASAGVLAAAFPLDATLIDATARGELAQLAGAEHGDDEAAAAYAAGARAAQRVLDRAASDGAANAWTGTIPVGDGLWFSAASGTPLRPAWGAVRTWLISSGSALRPAPPPAWGSAEFRGALAEVRRISGARTAEQTRIALFWADGAGTATPPGHWNAIAADLIERHHFDEEKATRTLALLNMALMDAGVACWDAKYHYWLIRPSQADPGIVTAVPLPNFPSYVSGHATFSGAAAELLGAAFPSERRSLDAMADEAAMSRLYGGIHYRFDNDQGLALGRKIGRLAAGRLR